MDKDRVEERIHISKSNSFTWTEKLNCYREVFLQMFLQFTQKLNVQGVQRNMTVDK